MAQSNLIPNPDFYSEYDYGGQGGPSGDTDGIMEYWSHMPHWRPPKKIYAPPFNCIVGQAQSSPDVYSSGSLPRK